MIFSVVYVNLAVKNLLTPLVYMRHFTTNFFGDIHYFRKKALHGVRNANLKKMKLYRL